MAPLILSILISLFFNLSFATENCQVAFEAVLEKSVDNVTKKIIQEEKIVKELENSKWWGEIRKKNEIAELRRPVSEESRLLQEEVKHINLQEKSTGSKKIDDMINSSSSSLRETRSIEELTKEWGEMASQGSWAPTPKDPNKLRQWRKEATLFAQTKASKARETGENIIDEDFIKTVYGKMMGEGPKPMSYRTHQPITGGKTISGGQKIFEYMPPKEVGPAMKEFVQELQHRIDLKRDPIDTAIWIERTLVSIHPFADGNGRMTREIAASYLHSQGLPRPLFLKGEEHSFAILPDPEFPMQTYEEIRKIYIEGIKRHIKLLKE